MLAISFKDIHGCDEANNELCSVFLYVGAAVVVAGVDDDDDDDDDNDDRRASPFLQHCLLLVLACVRLFAIF